MCQLAKNVLALEHHEQAQKFCHGCGNENLLINLCCLFFDLCKAWKSLRKEKIKINC